MAAPVGACVIFQGPACSALLALEGSEPRLRGVIDMSTQTDLLWSGTDRNRN